ncbi:MAG: hypothetical protein K0R54_4623 [Clostridiaceae bacterium]|jgi:tRNA (adenine22-N1)-methyltransferase|nr:hypothetical protein [Clostridiaceae bacterium]
MEISNRLEKIASMIEKCHCIADIGTDHGYLPIYLIKSKICDMAIASDINRGPINKAKLNIGIYALGDKIDCRLGAGLTTIKPFECNGIIIAGMGGNLIRDILAEGENVVSAVDFAVLQPVQNPEVLREFIYKKGYTILDEELCIDENVFYEIIKIKHCKLSKKEKIDPIYYEISKTLIDKKHPLMEQYIDYKINKYKQIFNHIKEESNWAIQRKNEVFDKINRLKEMKSCL